MSSEAGAGIKWRETKGLRFGCLNHFPNVDTQLAVNELELIDERDVDAAVYVFQQLGCFGGATGGNRNERFNGD